MTLESRFPILVFALCVAVGVVLAPWPALSYRILSDETGLIELGTVLVALWGCVLSLRLMVDKRLPYKGMAVWFGLFALGLFFLAGEEASWGQSWLHWQTPAGFEAMNKQGETNLHNLSASAEGVPKGLITLAALVTLIWAWRAKGKSPTMGGWFGWLWPSAAIWPAAALVWVTRLGERILVWTDWEDVLAPQYDATRESIELFCGLFILAYLANVRKRVLSEDAARS